MAAIEIRRSGAVIDTTLASWPPERMSVNGAAVCTERGAARRACDALLNGEMSREASAERSVDERGQVLD